MSSGGQKDSLRGRRRVRLLAGLGRAAALVALAAAACVLLPGATARAASGPPRVVVADIDSGINVYHSFLYAGGDLYKTAAPSSVTPEVLAAFGIDAAHQITLTRTGNFATDYAADLIRVWSKIRPGEPYWFKGTNIIAVSFSPGARPILPDDDADTHGFGTASAVLRANPEAIVLFVEGISDDSERYAFTHPEVDVVTTSYGIPGSVPVPSAVFGNAYTHLNQSFHGVVHMGKLHFGAADNSPALSPPDGTSGPWWSIGVAGFQEAIEGSETGSEGKQVVSGSLPDFVADFTQTLPYCADCESGGFESVSGTSFATPRSAGTASKVILEARRALGHVGGMNFTPEGEYALVVGSAGRQITNWQVRRALEQGAYYPRLAQFQPTTTGTYNLTSAPTIDQAPWATVGWGVITPAAEHQVVEQTLAFLKVRGSILKYKDQNACTYMTTQVQARHLFWDNWLDSQSNGYAHDPYIYCGPYSE
ncbi:MAG TPA: S8/S53 family peptidase [Pyrinomonadaceae bacterium]